MSRLDPAKLRVCLRPEVSAGGPLVPRRYTLTHSDVTGELFLTIGAEYEADQVGGWYTRLMRDEVLAEWVQAPEGPALRVYCHVSGGLVFGTAGMRDAIFRRELPLVLEALRHGDRGLFAAQPELDGAAIVVVFHSHRPRLNRVETWGTPADYRSLS